MAAEAPPAPPHAQEVFLQILGPLTVHARFAFRHVGDFHRREDLIQEAVCVAWKWTVRMLEKGKDPRAFPTAVAVHAARHVKSGRTFVGGKGAATDALSRHAQVRCGFAARSIHARADERDLRRAAGSGERRFETFEEFLSGHDRAPVPEQVAFKIDFAAWRATQDPRRLKILDAMIAGERTLELAGTFAVSAGRISQFRREFLEAWRAFCGD
jgi:hypothetical protein